MPFLSNVWKIIDRVNKTKKQSVQQKKQYVNNSLTSCQFIWNPIVDHNGHGFLQLWSTLRLDLVFPDCLKYITECLNSNAVISDHDNLVDQLKSPHIYTGLCLNESIIRILLVFLSSPDFLNVASIASITSSACVTFSGLG